MAPSFLADLEAHVAAFEDADSAQNEGGETCSGATANFGSLLNEALGKVKTLDAIIHNFYRNQSAKLGAWSAATHVERQSKSKTPPAPPQ